MFDHYGDPILSRVEVISMHWYEIFNL